MIISPHLKKLRREYEVTFDQFGAVSERLVIAHALIAALVHGLDGGPFLLSVILLRHGVVEGACRDRFRVAKRCGAQARPRFLVLTLDLVVAVEIRVLSTQSLKLGPSLVGSWAPLGLWLSLTQIQLLITRARVLIPPTRLFLV